MTKALVLALATVSAVFLGSPAHASSFAFSFVGGGVNGSINLNYEVNPNTGVLPQTSPNSVDPIGSYIVTGISGTFSDTNIGIADAVITGIVPSNPANPSPDNLLAPRSFGFYPIASGVNTPGGIAPGLSYDNLFYPGGSPQTASDYPFSGGFFDIYGIVFTIQGGNAVNFWSNGNAGGGVNYGVAVTDGLTLLDYVGPVSVTTVPEPAAWALMVSGFGLAGIAMRRRPRVVAA